MGEKHSYRGKYRTFSYFTHSSNIFKAAFWISEAILLSREEFTKIVKESSQTVANNVFAGVLGAMAQQVNMGAVPMSQMIGMVPNSVPVNGSIHVTDVEALDNELAADTSAKMDNSTKSMLGSLFDMDDD